MRCYECGTYIKMALHEEKEYRRIYSIGDGVLCPSCKYSEKRNAEHRIKMKYLLSLSNVKEKSHEQKST
jgi:hypothetical protein